ncbi:hypothetical protein [uncultured Fibrobacter sp.]|uniref:DUF6973 domain-containing protein n=1 Tax=uncultured Fibrobacter sp. TaxID=261512 RepID=UPI0028055C7D|nr:hypothetical protein [uncultured Fibrobacter sp.]
MNDAYKLNCLPIPYPDYASPSGAHDIGTSPQLPSPPAASGSTQNYLPFGDSFRDKISMPTSDPTLPTRLADYTKEANRKTAIAKFKNLAKQVYCMKGLLPDNWKAFSDVGLNGYPDTNITSKAYAFSKADNILSTEFGDDGSERGAFRHILWQSDIASRYDENVAQIIGNCHERNKTVDPNQMFFNTLAEADPTIDLLNNVIGRAISKKHPNLTTKQLALKILDYMREDGFYTAVPEANGFRVIKRTLSKDTYEKMYDEIANRRDEYGKPSIR